MIKNTDKNKMIWVKYFGWFLIGLWLASMLFSLLGFDNWNVGGTNTLLVLIVRLSGAALWIKLMFLFWGLFLLFLGKYAEKKHK